MGKILKIGVISVILVLVLAVVHVRLILIDDRRGGILTQLHSLDNGRFDFDALEDSLNRKFQGDNLMPKLRAFVESNGGQCRTPNLCHLYLTSTVCASTIAKVRVDENGRVQVEGWYDGC